MKEQRPSITLGYDGSGWTSADIEAEIQSLSEPDRKVPLTMQLVGAPDIFAYSLPSNQSEHALARVSLKPDATLPADLKGTIEVIADPATEIMMGVMQAMSPIAIPQIRLPQMRATVDVHLIPYDLEITWNDSVVSDGQTVELDGDAKSKGQLLGRVYKVDGRGQKVGEALSAQFKVTSKWKEVDWVELQDGSTGKELKASLLSKKLHLQPGPKDVGVVTLETQIKGQTIRRHLNLVVNPLTVQLTEPKPAELKPKEQTNLELVVTNSKGKGVAGVPVTWTVNPELGSLGSASGATDGQGKFTTSYTAPELEKLESETSLTASATVGPDKDWEGQVSLTLLYERVVTVAFSKKGFTDVSQTYTMTSSGPLTVNCKTQEGTMPVAYVTASFGEIKATSDSAGNISLAIGKTGSGHAGGTVSMELAPYCKSWITRIEHELKLLTHKDWTTSHLSKSATQTQEFVTTEYPKRLASEPEESFDTTLLNIKMLASVVRVGDKARALLRRRYTHMTTQIEQFFMNLAGAIFAVFGEKIFAKLADFFGSAFRKFFGWLATKISKSDLIMSLVKKGTRKFKSIIGSLEDLLKSQKAKLKGARVPKELTNKIPSNPGKGPFKHSPGDMANLKFFDKLADQARIAVKKAKHLLTEAQHSAAKAKKTLSKLESSLSKAKANLARSQNPKTVAKWEKKIRDLGGEIGSATNRVAETGKSLKATQKAYDAAQKGLLDAEEAAKSVGIFDDLLAAMMGCFNRLYLLCQLSIAWLCMQIVRAGDDVLKEILQEWHPRMGGSLTNMLNDKIYKPIFQMATGAPVGKGVSTVIERTVVWTQSNMISTSLDASLRHCGQWKEYDKETLKDALRYYFNDIDAASFRGEADDVWMEYIADVLDWLEFLIVWSVRIANVVIGLVSILLTAVSFGTSLVAGIAINAALAVWTEILDTVWDVLKAACRGLTSMASVAQVVGVIVPAHTGFTARLYSDDNIYDAADQACNFPMGEDLQKFISGLPRQAPAKIQKVMAKVDGLGKS